MLNASRQLCAEPSRHACGSFVSDDRSRFILSPSTKNSGVL